MNKRFVIILFPVTFLIAFTVTYKRSGKVRESIRIAIIWLIISASALAKDKWFPGVEGFTPPAHSRPANKDTGLFNQPKPQNPGSDKPGGNGGDDDDSNSKPEPKCIDNSKDDNSYKYWHEYEMSPKSDSETNSDSDSDWDEETFLEHLSVTAASDGRKIDLEKKQFRDKAHHLDVFPNIEIPKTFDLDYVKSLDYKSRLEYVRDPSKLPEKTVFAMQMEASKFFRSTQTEHFRGCLGRNKIQGTVYINKRTRTVAFVNESNSVCRTIIKMSPDQLDRLKDRDYHLFPIV